MQTVLEQLAQKVDSLDAQLHLLTASTVKGPSANSSDPEGSQQTQDGVDELASKKESNKTYLKSLDIQKVSCKVLLYTDKLSTKRIYEQVIYGCLKLAEFILCLCRKLKNYSCVELPPFSSCYIVALIILLMIKHSSSLTICILYSNSIAQRP